MNNACISNVLARRLVKAKKNVVRLAKDLVYLPHVTFQRSCLRENSIVFKTGSNAFHGGKDNPSN